MKIKTVTALIKTIEQYDAHFEQKEDSVRREALSAHIEETAYYFGYLWKQKCGDDILGRFIQMVFGKLSEEAEVFLKEMIFAIPVFHDFGKINPEFQVKMMKNNKVQESRMFMCVGSKHSMISAVIYLDYFLRKLPEAVKNKEEKQQLRRIMLYHAYIIERHHSDLTDFREFTDKLLEGCGRDIAEVLLEKSENILNETFTLSPGKIHKLMKITGRRVPDGGSIEKDTGIYAYVKLLYSLLVASDYYATASFMNHVRTDQFGEISEIDRWADVYEKTALMQRIRLYQKCSYPMPSEKLHGEKDINVLRTEMFCDAENILKAHSLENFFYLEAPTGSGKSNMALNLSFQMLKADKRLKKIYYIYPFNTLVEQNIKNLEKLFGHHPEIFNLITVVNALTPIKMTEKEKAEEEASEQTGYYQKALLDRQFLNYPMIVSTHVSLFDTMFGDSKASAFGFHQLMNSVIVLDEIQSYKNTLWGEIISFLKTFSYLLNIKIIIMSATLPDLDLLSAGRCPAVHLMREKEKYFLNPVFKERVQISYELMESADIENDLYAHVKKTTCGANENGADGKKILVAFIKKATAQKFFNRLREDEEITCDVEYMSGEDSLAERSRILDKMKHTQKTVILVATQVVEAGVDIDMDFGYKNVSKLDSEEQFLGRINRSCCRTGMVWFFKMDDGKAIYREDVRINKMFTLENDEMKKLLSDKNFYTYYEKILEVLNRNYIQQTGPDGMESFFSKDVGRLNWGKVKERMQLIPEDKWQMSVYLARVIEDENGEMVDGAELWHTYTDLLKDFKMDYAEKKVRLSRITGKMNHFIYQIKKNNNLIYNDKVGELYYIEDGEKYFDHGKLNRDKIQGELGDFVDFI